MYARRITSEPGLKAPSEGEAGVVAAADPLAADAMADVLKFGGNAMDAVLAGMTVQTVVEPQMTSLAGGMSVLYHDATTGSDTFLDAELDHTHAGPPTARSWDEWYRIESRIGETSPARIGVPGMVAGMAEAASRFGRLGWARLFDAAVAIATEGFEVSSFLSNETAAASQRIAASPSARSEFLIDGFLPVAGQVLRRPRLAATLTELASSGPDHFYSGPWAGRFVDAAHSDGGLLTEEDLAGYRVRVSEPLRTPLGEFEVVSAPPPSTGGALIGLVTQIAQSVGLGHLGHYAEDARALYLLRQAVGFAEYLTDAFIGDPLGCGDVGADLSGSAIVDSLAALMTARSARPLPACGLDRAALGPRMGGARRDRHASNTDHLVAIDVDGNTATLTHSIYGTTFGTGLVVDGVPANSGNNFPGARRGDGRRVVSPFPPTILRHHGVPRFAMGSPGLAARAVALVLVNHLEYGLGPTAAIDAPRFQGSQPDQPCVVESRIAPEVLSELTEFYGVDVRTTVPYDWHFGAVAVIESPDCGTGQQVSRGYVDPRRPGCTIAV